MTARIEEHELTSLVKKAHYTVLEDTTVTICYIELHSGFSVIGQSGTIDKANFNKAEGEKYAYENAFSKLWELEGYHRVATAQAQKQ